MLQPLTGSTVTLLRRRLDLGLARFRACIREAASAASAFTYGLSASSSPSGSSVRANS